MPAFKVIITPEALADLEAIHAYIAVDSPNNAARMVERLLETIDGLGDMPRRFPRVRTRRQLGYEPRAVVVRPYRIIYSVEGTTVHVRTVRHGARRPWP